MTNHQRIGSTSNAHVGRDFEAIALEYFMQHEGVALQSPFSVPVGVGDIKKSRRFDLGSDDLPILVECKSHHWTESGNMPSAKMTVWNEAMFYFHIAPPHFRKVLFVLRSDHPMRRETLAEYYVRTNRHLISANVSILEYDELRLVVRSIDVAR